LTQISILLEDLDTMIHILTLLEDLDTMIHISTLLEDLDTVVHISTSLEDLDMVFAGASTNKSGLRGEALDRQVLISPCHHRGMSLPMNNVNLCLAKQLKLPRI